MAHCSCFDRLLLKNVWRTIWNLPRRSARIARARIRTITTRNTAFLPELAASPHLQTKVMAASHSIKLETCTIHVGKDNAFAGSACAAASICANKNCFPSSVHVWNGSRTINEEMGVCLLSSKKSTAGGREEMRCTDGEIQEQAKRKERCVLVARQRRRRNDRNICGGKFHGRNSYVSTVNTSLMSGRRVLTVDKTRQVL